MTPLEASSIKLKAFLKSQKAPKRTVWFMPITNHKESFS